VASNSKLWPPSGKAQKVMIRIYVLWQKDGAGFFGLVCCGRKSEVKY